MRTFSLRSLTFACLASGLLLTASCNRKSDDAAPDDITTAEDRSEDNIETAVSSDAKLAGPTDPTVQGSSYATTDAEFRARFGSCATRSYDYNTRTLTIDFGPTNCLCPDGRYRRGQILVRFTTDVQTRRAGAVVTRQNYFVNDNQHTATRTFTDLGLGSFSVDVTNASIIRANNGGTHSWTASWTFTQTAGFGTPQFSDDVFSVTGSSAGTNRNGVGYTTTVQSPLTKRGDCFKYFVQGTISISNTKGKTMVLDYGNGACDNTATVSINGRTRTITLR
ncbi:hypothetical protein [Hymenobacter properus]|uniref:Lipoprotein n=1 Tax=Hymenobacter properus TaxID=2791026 RepID=A0A931BFV1_9BACT|nr:hypothetical protein [Hymenobacter properus]MBF9141527.1 hypothetical protein [Hymenobacter properus]MBR7720336.1 hypothetical protein [Microvirga sp. SRT04]